MIYGVLDNLMKYDNVFSGRTNTTLIEMCVFVRQTSNWYVNYVDFKLSDPLMHGMSMIDGWYCCLFIMCNEMIACLSLHGCDFQVWSGIDKSDDYMLMLVVDIEVLFVAT